MCPEGAQVELCAQVELYPERCVPKVLKLSFEVSECKPLPPSSLGTGTAPCGRVIGNEHSNRYRTCPHDFTFRVNAQADAWRRAEAGEEIQRVKSLVLEGTATKCLVPPCLAVVDAHHAQHKLPAQPQRQWRLGVDDGLCTCREHGVGCQVSLGLADIAVLA